MGEETRRVLRLRQDLLARLLAGIPGLVLNGSADQRLAGNLNLIFPNSDAQAIMAACPTLCVSTGSACSSAEIEPSYVLRALGLDTTKAARSLRIGIGRFTSAADIAGAAEALVSAAQMTPRHRLISRVG
jgi:cysteine desulfurase